MAKTLKFVYSVIIFLSPFLVVMKVDGGKLFFNHFRIFFSFFFPYIIFYLILFYNIIISFLIIIELIKCTTDADCPTRLNRKWLCINNICRKMCVTNV